MVHALKEIWRVLAPGGYLIDLRPHSGKSPVEVVGAGWAVLAGLVDESLDSPDEIAANESMTYVIHKGWFVHDREESFKFALYWDTPDEMKAYTEEKWTHSYVPAEVLTEVRRLMANNDKEASVRIRQNMIISRYRKHPVRSA